jgi:hypothetical protein
MNLLSPIYVECAKTARGVLALLAVWPAVEQGKSALLAHRYHRYHPILFTNRRDWCGVARPAHSEVRGRETRAQLQPATGSVAAIYEQLAMNA